MIIGSEVRHSHLVVNEISHKKLVVPEGVTGANFDFGSSQLIGFSYTLNYYTVQFGMI
jgi:hypothetical protein